jgi:hypothetical protein
MRQSLMVVSVLIGGGLALNVAPLDAAAGALPVISAPPATHALIEQAGYWKRRWRNGYYGPEIVVPDAQVDLDVDSDVDVEVDAPAVIVSPPPRPLSCGEYRYWNGDRCVDARYNNPYIGPK